MAEKQPLVWLDAEGYVNVLHTGGWNYIYDFQVTEAMPADVWIRQLSRKTWVTSEHMRQLHEVLESIK